MALAETHLYKALLKSKPISTAPGFPQWIAKQIQKSSLTLDTASANVTARLFNSNPVKAALDIVLGSMHIVLDLPVDDVPRRKKRLRAADYKAKAQDTGLGKPNKTQNIEQQDHSESLEVQQLAPQVSGVPVDLQSINVSESESEDYDIYNARLAESSGDDRGVSSAVLSDDEDGDEVQGVRINRSMPPRHDPISSLSPSPSLSSYLSPSPSPPPVSRTSAPSKAPKATTFLPTLNGGYWSGSESSDVEGDKDDVPSAIAPRKNRRGQQERRAIWEKKFGVKAKHLDNQGVDKAISTRDEGWDLKRGASDGNVGRGRGRGGRSIRAGRGGGQGTVRSGANSDPVNGLRVREREVKQVSKSKSDEGPLHPSWEAKKKAKEKAGSISMAFQGKKVIFD